jgi:trans-aconitate methyltransferase
MQRRGGSADSCSSVMPSEKTYTVTELDASTLERIIPERADEQGATGADTLKLHLERYQFAVSRLKPGAVLDIACGVGYGTELLSRAPGVTSVIGVDVDPGSIAYAERRYASGDTRFLCADAMAFSPGARFQTIVSLETIEHVTQPLALFARLVSLLEPCGLLISSVPVTLSTDANPHHLTDWTEASFRRLGSMNGLRVVDELRQVQAYSPVALLRKTETRAQGLRKGMANYYLQHPEKLIMRCWSTLRYGFTNRYLTVAWEKPA